MAKIYNARIRTKYCLLSLRSMGIIEVENIRLYAHHGCMAEETKIGSNYRVDVRLEADLSVSSKSDDLKDTVDYVSVHAIVKEEMSVPSKLLEHVVQRIIERVRALNGVQKVRVRVAKENPPIDGDVGYVAVAIEESV